MATAMLHALFRLREMDDFPGPFAPRARKVSEELREMWERTSREAVSSRRLAELHAARDDYRALLEGHLRLLEDYLGLSEIHQRAFGSNPIWVTELRRAVTELKGLHDELFPRWQTANDLHEMMVEKFSVPSDTLRELAAESPPPPSWAEETIDPFSAD
ncbi:hypothetical protein [Frigoriglobus tundricola]|uniref:Uncharacterized protein n=1 Tax=Frigoriglobus tundricola TaxID=2774151 RepID=A0A6M5YR38_9BACT|nr:hypothetical protein [Frigoriglobus tundricola]QJW96505.1 hypothetical protein FTUN_4062 [Frigoriglobus tundricola]